MQTRQQRARPSTNPDIGSYQCQGHTDAFSRASHPVNLLVRIYRGTMQADVTQLGKLAGRLLL